MGSMNQVSSQLIPKKFMSVICFIDGYYLRKNIRDIFSKEFTGYQKLIGAIMHELSTDHIMPHLIRTYYYDAIASDQNVEQLTPDVSEIAKEKIEKTSTTQNQYIKEIEKTDFFEIKLGRLVLSTKGGAENKDNWEFRQKGVDSLIAIDMLSKAYENHYDWAVLIAGDADFVDLVKAVKNAGKQVFGFYFEKSASKDLIKNFDRKFAIDKLTNFTNLY